MCMHCETVSYWTPFGACFEPKEECGKLWWHDGDSPFRWLGREDEFVLKFCPWCGRKLKAPIRPQPSPHQQVAAYAKDDYHSIEERLSKIERDIEVISQDLAGQFQTLHALWSEKVEKDIQEKMGKFL